VRSSTLFLLPNVLGDEAPLDQSLPSGIRDVIAHVRHFIVEDEKPARRLLKMLLPTIDLRSLSVEVLNEHTSTDRYCGLLEPLQLGHDMAIISGAGCPVIADPGSPLVMMAHQHGMRVWPLVGPSSILLALMASGLTGQRFAFHGYLPIESAERRARIKLLDERAHAEGSTQIFIETPYRNNSLVKDLFSVCRPESVLSVAVGLTTKDEKIMTRTISEWRSHSLSLEKIPAVFLIGTIT
jgi:16S rRNA (cytidine1402-2'-O)-methyltransferase